MIFQDPFGSLNPRMTVGRIVEEPLIIYGLKDKKVRREQLMEMMNLVGLDEKLLSRLPHELSGGQRQRVSIAAALIAGPRLLVADESVSALDATIQAQILDLLWDIHKKLSLSILFISHDLAVVESICDRVLVMERGEIVRLGTVDEVFTDNIGQAPQL
jgi:ABC-type glutathione transport system ATPase component